MAAISESKSKPKTRNQSSSKLSDFVGKGKEFIPSEVPTARAVIQRGILIKEKLMIENEKGKYDVSLGEIVKELVPLIMFQWKRSNAKFSPPVIIQEKSLTTKVERLWKRVENVAWVRVKQAEKDRVVVLLD